MFQGGMADEALQSGLRIAKAYEKQKNGENDIFCIGRYLLIWTNIQDIPFELDVNLSF